MPYDQRGSQMLACAACGAEVPISKDPKFCPVCGAPFVAAPAKPAQAEKPASTAEDVLKSVDDLLLGLSSPGSLDPSARPPAPPKAAPSSSSASDAPLLAPPDSVAAQFPSAKSRPAGATGLKKSLESYIEEAEKEEAEHRIKRLTVVERKTKQYDTFHSKERLVCQNCKQIYSGQNIHVQKCMTCGSSYLKRATEDELAAAMAGEPAPELAPEPAPDLAQVEQPPSGQDGKAEDGEANENKAPFDYMGEDADFFDMGKSGQGDRNPETAVPVAAPPGPAVEAEGAATPSPEPEEPAPSRERSPRAEPAEAARGWEAALRQKEPIHKRRRELSSFSHEFFLNKQIGGYMVKELIGRGAMGTVFKAVRLKDEKTLALKILPLIYSSDKGRVERFNKEAMSAMKLDHPNIVKCYDIGVEGDINFIAMEFVEGQSVGDLIKEKRALKIEESLRIIKEAATGLGAAHEKGIVHRDIKPDNILIASDDRIMVADFGLARDTEASGSFSNTGEIVGTPYYISPEQIDCLEVDQRADIYSLGATIYHLITGKHPYQGETPMEVLLKHMNEKLVPPVDRNPLIPHSVSRLIERMMEKNREFRYGTISELIADIEVIEKGGVPQITLEREKEAGPQQKKKKKKSVVIRPRSHLLIGSLSVAVITAAAVILRFTVLPPVDASPVLSAAEQFNPAEFELMELERDAARGAAPHSVLSERCRAIVRRYPESTQAGKAKALEARIAADAARALSKWFSDALAGAAMLEKERKWDASIAVLDSRPDGPAPSAEMLRSLAAARQRIMKSLSAGGMAFIPRGTALVTDASGAVLETTVPAFFIDTAEVTIADYRKFVDASGARAPWTGGFPAHRAGLPVTSVSFDEAKAYASWAGKRLPTEAEWCRAAYGDDKLPFPWGRDFDSKKCNFLGARIGDLVEAGSYPEGAGPFGCLNMAGNAAEWTSSLFDPRSANVAIMGGSYLSPAAALKAGTRFLAPPDYSHPSLGFRCAKDYRDGK